MHIRLRPFRFVWCIGVLVLALVLASAHPHMAVLIAAFGIGTDANLR